MRTKELGAILLACTTLISSGSGCQKVDHYMNTPPSKWLDKEASRPKRPILDWLSSQVKTTDDPLLRTDGTRVQQGEIYHGNTWPSQWPILNEDGSYNKDYIRWYSRR